MPSDPQTTNEVRAAVMRRRALPQRLSAALDGAEGDARQLLQDALDEVERHRANTVVEVGWTYEPTGERVRLFAPDHQSLAITAKHPETLSLICQEARNV